MLTCARLVHAAFCCLQVWPCQEPNNDLEIIGFSSYIGLIACRALKCHTLTWKNLCTDRDVSCAPSPAHATVGCWTSSVATLSWRFGSDYFVAAASASPVISSMLCFHLQTAPWASTLASVRTPEAPSLRILGQRSFRGFTRQQFPRSFGTCHTCHLLMPQPITECFSTAADTS